MAKVHGCYSVPVRLSWDFLVRWKVKNLTLILVLLWDKSCDSFYIILVMDLYVLDCQLHVTHTYWLLHVFLSVKHNFVSCRFPAALGSVVAKNRLRPSVDTKWPSWQTQTHSRTFLPHWWVLRGLYTQSTYWQKDTFKEFSVAPMDINVGEWCGEVREAGWKHGWRVTSQRLLQHNFYLYTNQPGNNVCIGKDTSKQNI